MNNLEEIIKHTLDLNVLYVEDNIEAMKMTKVLFEEFFNDIYVAYNGKEGLEEFKKHKVDLIIVDINMPVMNGLDMISEIKLIDKDVPILVLSAYNEPEYFIESIRLGVDGYLLKPIEEEAFLISLDKIVKNIKLKEEALKNQYLITQYKEITDKSTIITVLNTQGVITYVNDKFCEISEYSKEQLEGVKYYDLFDYKFSSDVFDEMKETISVKKQLWQKVVKFISKYGKTYYLKTTIKPILDRRGRILEYIALRDDVSDIMNPKKLLIDAVLNIQNPLVVYLKIEDYNTLEEFYDHSIVEMIQDKLEIYIKKNISVIHSFKNVYQLGNGEYALLSEDSSCLKDSSSFITSLKSFQKKLKDDILYVDEIEYDMSVLISISCGDMVIENSKLGIKKLEKIKQDFIIANDLAKQEQIKAQKNMKTISTIKKAIHDFKIISYFQPIINNKTKEIEKYESLVRLIDEDENILSPFAFLDVAKKGKYYTQITSIVLDNSFNALKNTDMDISINLSALDLEKEEITNKLLELLSINKEHAHRIVLEFVEDEEIIDSDVIKKFIFKVKRYGVKIAIDDFGSGYSNFERILDYEPDIIKIDGSLIRNIQNDNLSLNIVETIVNFCKKLNINTVAEYVESEEIFNTLVDLGINYSQGYYFSQPKPLEDYDQINRSI